MPVRRGRGRRTGATQKARLLAAERRSKAVAMKLEGKSSPEIAAALGVSVAGVNKMIRVAIGLADETTINDVERLRARQLEIVKQLEQTFVPLAVQGRVPQTLALLRIMEREAKLGGLDAPDKFEHAGVGGSALPGVIVLPASDEEGDELEDTAPDATPVDS